LRFLARAVLTPGPSDGVYSAALSRMTDLDEYVRGRIAETVNERNAREAQAALRAGNLQAAPARRVSSPVAAPAQRVSSSIAAPEQRTPLPPVTVRTEYREALRADPTLVDALARLGQSLAPRAPRAPVPPEAAPQVPRPEDAATEATFVPVHPAPVRAGLKPSSRFSRVFEGIHPIFSDRPTAGR